MGSTTFGNVSPDMTGPTMPATFEKRSALAIKPREDRRPLLAARSLTGLPLSADVEVSNVRHDRKSDQRAIRMTLRGHSHPATGTGAAAQHLGRRGADPRDRRHGADRLWRRADHAAAVDARRLAGVARSGQSAALCAANHDADAAGDRLLDHLHLHLCGAGRQEPARRDGADPAARHPAIGADPRLSDLHRGVLPESVSRPACSAPSSLACSRSSPARPGT